MPGMAEIIYTKPVGLAVMPLLTIPGMLMIVKL